jgi:3-deoxy-D-manno-octulosonic-acid transferase
MFLLYNFLLTILSPIWAPWMWWRSRRRKEAPNWQERFGNYDLPLKPDKPRVWLHAVSVGEVIAALPVLRELRLTGDHELVLSVTTSSGHQTAREQADGLYDYLVYFPIDVARFQLAAMSRVKPKVVAIMETELWMNFLWSAKVFGAKTLLVNGRISDRSYPRSLRLRAYYSAVLRNVDRCLMQSPTDARRIAALGAQHAEVYGNTKTDEAVSAIDTSTKNWREELGLLHDLPVVVVGSTRSELEEELVSQAVHELGPERIQLIWAPRHLERADAVVTRLQTTGWQVTKRSTRGAGNAIVLDTFGELSSIYSVADIAIIGGGFDRFGGQNLLQPLAHGIPVLHGPYMNNFREAAEAAQAAGATVLCEDAAQLSAALRRLLEEPATRMEMGTAARRVIEASRGASARYARAILAALAAS